MLPLLLRNRLAELILDALRTSEARQALVLVWRFCADPLPSVPAGSLPTGYSLEFFERRGDALILKGDYGRFRDEMCERVSRAWKLLSHRPFSDPDPSLDAALDAAADLFDAGLYFEVHELLEPYWMRAGGGEREILQGLIQVATGFHHLANGNLKGARSLLDEGSAKLLGQRLEGRAVGPFALTVRERLDAIVGIGEAVPRSAVPGFPRPAGG